MAFRGRGRGRGRFGGGGGGFGYARQEPFIEFPEIELPDRKAVKEERALVLGNAKLLNFWKSSPYFLEESIAKKSQSMDIERFSDWGKPKTTAKRDALSNFLILEPMNFPKELLTGAKREQPNPKKVRWNPNSDIKKWDLFEKLEEKFQGREDKGEKEKKEGEDEEDEEDEEAQEAEEEPSDDDYNQNVDFDDDDDDYNDVDAGNNDEPEY
ncbi:uncharacterized protein [Euphorbia lathyris]|uniref:uncharacterized protein n=1 Tax=Euphorbia lathyris TaxID=212925 RepID=UPI00331324C2